MEEKRGVVHKIRSLHRIRKKKEELPPWKHKWNEFNEKYLGGLEHFVEKAIPWLVLLLLFIILGEFSGQINIYHWHWLELVTEFFHHHELEVMFIDKIIISFFIVDLYFNFFKKATLDSFLRTSILDIIAVAPLGLMFDVAGVGEAQKALHLTTEVEKEAVVVIKETKLARATAEEAAKIARLEKSTSFARFFSRIPRFFRLNRIVDFFTNKPAEKIHGKRCKICPKKTKK